MRYQLARPMMLETFADALTRKHVEGTEIVLYVVLGPVSNQSEGMTS